MSVWERDRERCTYCGSIAVLNMTTSFHWRWGGSSTARRCRPRVTANESRLEVTRPRHPRRLYGWELNLRTLADSNRRPTACRYERDERRRTATNCFGWSGRRNGLQRTTAMSSERAKNARWSRRACLRCGQIDDRHMDPRCTQHLNEGLHARSARSTGSLAASTSRRGAGCLACPR
jgi:hypothetical protein